MKVTLVTCSAVCFALVLLLTSGSSAPDGSAPPSATQPAEPVYKVKVNVREVKNRIVEGQVRGHKLQVDQPRQFGADDTAPTPPETLAFALGSCVVSTGRLIATQRHLPVRSIEVTVESELDFGRALGTSQDKRAGFAGFKITARIEADMSVGDKARFLEEITARCPMCDTVANPTPIDYELRQ